MKYLNKLRITGLSAMIGLFSNLNIQAGEDWGQFGRYENQNMELQSKCDSVKPRVVFIGNSITEGWVNEDPDFFSKNQFTGRGISGQTSYQILLRFRDDVINLKPEFVVINCGTNDIAENNHVYNENRTLGNIKSMSEIADANGIKVVLSSVLPTNHFYWNEKATDVSKRIISLNKKIKEYATQKGYVYLDYYEMMAAPGGEMIKDYTGDGVHPNLKGYKIMENEVEKKGLIIKNDN